jgi:hypothetical protein
MQEDDVIAAAEAITPHLPVLIGDDAPAVRAELDRLLARAAAGEPVKVELLRVLSKRDGTRVWVRSLLDVPSEARAFEPLPGPVQHVRLPRYECPQGDQEPWFRFDIRDEIPVCPQHNIAYVRKSR